MKILITSGGTKIPIDRVRSITNMSKGTFGSRICDSFWNKFAATKDGIDGMISGDNSIVFFHARGSKLPTAEAMDNELYDSGLSAIKYIEYDTFDSYREKLTTLLKQEKFDIIVLAAAVSDYGVMNPVDGKVRSTEDEMTIKLYKLPKVITEVRRLAPDSVICGFKLLVDSTDKELSEAIDKQLEENDIDLCVGNDLRDIKNDNHRLTIRVNKKYANVFDEAMTTVVEKNAFPVKCGRYPLADVVADKCLEVENIKRQS